MDFLQKIQAKLVSFERNEFYKNVGAYFGIVFLLMLGITYYYFSKTSELQSSLKKINRNRERVRLILQEHKAVQKQRTEVNTMLNEEKNFKIKNFFDGIVQQHQLKLQQTKETEISEEVLQKKYTEVKLTAQFKQISTQQLCELLNSVEQKARVYTKELTITKTRGASLDVLLTIATLRPQSETNAR